MKLHGVIFSPFVQPVLMAARIKGIELELTPLPAGGTQSAEFAAISPMRRMPVLEESDGWTMAESASIVAYLEETQPGPSLLPVDARDAAKARLIAGLVDTEIAAGLRHFIVQKLFRMQDEPALLDHGRAQLRRGLAAIEQIGVNGGRWAVGDQPSVADIALVPLLSLGDLITGHSDSGELISGLPGIDAYWARARADPLGNRSYVEMRDGFLASRKR